MERDPATTFDRSISAQEFTKEPHRWLESVSRGEIEFLRIELENSSAAVSIERDGGLSLATRLRVEEAITAQLAQLASTYVNIHADRLIAIAREEQQFKLGLNS
jgi:hypothetical protein